MKSAVKPQPRKRGRFAATSGTPLARADDERIAEAPAGPEGPAAEAAQPFPSDENQRPPQTDIERADEGKVGSVEAAPHPDPENGITGFVEATSDDTATG